MPGRDWTSYLLKCSDGSLYCGVTKNMGNRLIKHNEGTAAKYTRSRLPVELAAVKGDLTKREAYQLEYQIKKTPTHKKIATLNDWKPKN
ncbi:GIY-YIG nuclease family protein [uncultured Desulfobacter sp.]|uniref:GIY-YIG nuclease family protein n=1 Tax=uncultured Desulfobacter sp. TaxID=240139 RepID=UPI002AABC9A1|nr:GIY-YIG nuclease family protein [uncultured Desulfobacter sp.]